MKVKRYWKKILSLVLTSALLLGLLPTAAFAYSPDEKTDIIEFKAMPSQRKVIWHGSTI